MDADAKARLSDLFDDALDRYRDAYDESSTEIMKALDLFDEDFLAEAAYEIRSFSLEANGCIPTELEEWTENYK